MTEKEYLQLMEEKEAELIFAKKQVEILQSSLEELRQRAAEQAEQLHKEKRDIEELEKSSLSNLFNRLTGKMDEVRRREEKEYFEVKVRYDEIHYSLRETEKGAEAAGKKLELLQKDVAEMREQGRILFPAVAERFRREEEELIQLRADIKELEEAVDAGDEVLRNIWRAVDKLESARSWATYDMFTKGGLFSHMAKYGNIDDAQLIMGEIGYAIDRFQAELRDVDVSFHYRLEGYDSSTRFIDYFFDNIFTDMRVRGQITDDIDRLSDLRYRIERILDDLIALKHDKQHRIYELEEQRTGV